MRRACGSPGSRRSVGFLCSRLVCSSRTESPFSPASFSSTPQAAGVQSELLVQDVRPQGESVVIALGGNVGDRVQNLSRALECMRRAGIQVVRHACLYESAPAYVTDQPFFLNSAVAAVTKLSPDELLKTLKQIESELGRTFGGLRYGPRPVDLDIIFYGIQTVNTETLQIPHPRCMERPFVMAPLVDLLATRGSESPNHWSKHTAIRGGLTRAWSKIGGEASVGKEGLRRVFPVGSKLLEWAGRTHIMGILNITPDSFSDGGRYQSVDDAVGHARKLVADGADFIDIGPQSTSAGIPMISTEEELARLLPVLDALAKEPAMEGVGLSVDTLNARVAREAVNRGVHIVNDISGGCWDPEMIPTVADLRVPLVVMHMPGAPVSLQCKPNEGYGDVVEALRQGKAKATHDDVCVEVGQEIGLQVQRAEAAGIPAWRIITDIGIGYIKTEDENLELLRNIPSLRKVLSDWSPASARGPMLVGPSRKDFLGKIIGRQKAEERDAATIAAVVLGAIGGGNIMRVHNVQAVRDAVTVVDAICKR